LEAVTLFQNSIIPVFPLVLRVSAHPEMGNGLIR
jgi:hypothetical protein